MMWKRYGIKSKTVRLIFITKMYNNDKMFDFPYFSEE